MLIIPNEGILLFLNTQEISELHYVNKLHLGYLRQIKAIKNSIWRGDLPSSIRAKFWIYQCPIYKVQQDVCKMLRLAESYYSPYSYIQVSIQEHKTLEESTLDLEFTKTEIMKDIPRTQLITENKREQAQLLRILLAFAYIKPSIGYCQGINFLGAVLLRVVKSEEIAFLLLLGMMKKWDMENMYVHGVPDLSLREYQMDYFLHTMLPDLYNHFRKVGLTNGCFISRWFMTLFSTYFPLDTLLRVWDCFFLDGWKAIIKFSIALLREIKPTILQYDLEEISIYLKKHTNNSEYRYLLAKSRVIHASKLELKKIEQQFYTEQASLKLVAAENSHSLSDKEIKAMRWAKSKFESFDGLTKRDVSEFWRKIEKLDQELENFSKHYLMVSMDFLKIQHEVEILIEKKNMYSRIYNEMKCEYKRFKFPGFLLNLMPQKKIKKGMEVVEIGKIVPGNISKVDLKMCEEKLKKATQELNELQRQYLEKANMYRDVCTRSQEIREKKRIYSEQLCDFIGIYR